MTSPARLGKALTMLFFFSNRTGCMGSLLVSVIGTLILLALTGVIRLF